MARPLAGEVQRPGGTVYWPLAPERGPRPRPGSAGRRLAALRFRFDMRSSRITSEVLATRGQRLVLWRERWELADRDVGPSESAALVVAECDKRGDCVALVALESNLRDI